ncbi:collagen-like protein [Aquimarina agarivorans]|uniref:collagen-like protein n=1 Tax=Aquimarina agarivorans TaxID=980584 RepID=UPI000248F2B6|nr:collagen-like protein [Aquimarina agarivorans]
MSGNLNVILKKLTNFIKRYYINELIKGSLLFIAIGLVYFLVVLLLENFLWFSTQGRRILFWTFIGIELLLFIKFIGISLAKLAKFGNRISSIEASKIIGAHFPEIKDQLVNLLQLSSNDQKSELLEASIAQKSAQLSPIPFNLAIDFKKSLSYAKYALIPLVVFLLVTVVNGKDWFGKSLTRVVNYNTAYEPPAPFHFKILNDRIEVIQQQDFILNVTTYGSIVPNQVVINYDNETYFLKKQAHNKFSYTFKNPIQNIPFTLSSGDESSREYQLLVNAAPSINKFQMVVTSPKHVKQKDKIYDNTGNAIVAEGSKISWFVASSNASIVRFSTEEKKELFKKNTNQFSFTKQVYNATDYQITTSNKHVEAYEKLAFAIDVIKDKNPSISVQTATDTTKLNTKLFYGQLADDYGLKRLNVVYFKQNDPENKQQFELPIQKGIFSDFTYEFPNQLNLEDATSYSFYFEVFDNDSFNGSKSTKSETFNYRQLSKVEAEQTEFKNEQNQLDQFSKSLDEFQKSDLDLETFSKLQKQQNTLSFKEKKKLSDVLDKQSKQQKSLEKLSTKLNKTLEKLDKNKDSEAIKEQLERTKKELEKNKKLVDEIKKALEKLTPKELQEKVDELQKENKKQKKNLSQVLELTKRYYVIDKHQRIVQMLELLSDKELKLADAVDPLKSQKQAQINKEWKIIQDELNDLRRHNLELKKPMKLDDDPAYEETIKKELDGALNDLEKSNNEAGAKKQKTAATMLKNLADKMSTTAGGGGGGMEQLEEDLEMLRQILDNLVLFSLNQEDNMNAFGKSTSNDPNYSAHVRRQNVLREHFEHIDDSLFAISSRNAKMGIKINDLISDIDYDMSLALDKITDNRTSQGVTSLQFAVSHSNDLALILSKSLMEMEQQTKPGKSGEGKKKQGFQLPDIIKKQESLNKAMEQMLQSQQKQAGDSKKEQAGGKKKPGDKGEPGDKGKQGKEGDKGDQGENGKEGKDGKSGQDGTEGENGKSGKGKGTSGEGEGEGSEKGKGGKDGKQGNKDGKGKDGDKSGKGENGKDGEGDKGEGKDGEGKNGGKGKKGKNGKVSGGSGDGESESEDESDYEQIFEIYKQQQDLRNQLEDKMRQEGITPNQQRILDQMEQVEDELLEQGFSEETMKRMVNLKHQLFKLDKAQFQQGKDNNRKSTTNQKEFQSKESTTPEQIKQYFNTTEILNRQVLPLQPEFKKRVQEYFIDSK